MSWTKVRLIFARELRDQLRDRRTLFMITVLPILLYPFMGMAFLQIAQFLQESPARVGLAGVEGLPNSPDLLDDEKPAFAADLFASASGQSLIEVEVIEPTSAAELETWAQATLEAGEFDTLVYFPPDFSEQLEAYLSTESSGATPPRPQVFFSGAKDRSRIAYERVSAILSRWRGALVKQALESREIPVAAAKPFVIGDRDVAEESGRRAAMWAKLLPVVMILWAVTGAFYPAIDLCAGEKERGTLETLLCSPAERSEIVWGKLLTVTLFSVATAVLNLVSLTATGALILGKIYSPIAGAAPMGPPPISTLVWLLFALLPISAMFSALSLALATMSRSTKEGQYYLMPLVLVTMPLAMISVMPSTQISMGNALIPITGVMLLLRSLIEGNYIEAVKYFVPVTMVTGACCMLSIRWAVHQFNDESVLFRESERFSLGLWLRHLVRDRGVTPSLAEGVMCGMLLLMFQFFVRLLAPAPTGWSDFVVSTLVVQIGLIAAPVALMTFVLTSSPRRTLLLTGAPWGAIVAALMLTFFLIPLETAFRAVVMKLYPVSSATIELLEGVAGLIDGVPSWQLILLMALTPAICEELAFRGFIMSGLRHIGSRTLAIMISSLFFGIIHGVLQQSINAFALGVVLGYIAVQTGSILPCMVFHFAHNASQILLTPYLSKEFLEEHPRMSTFFVESEMMGGALLFRTPFVVASILATGLLLQWFRSLPSSSSPEERLHKALDKSAATAS